MRIACIIMAHKDPQQIERLIKKFGFLPFDFYIHLDKKIKRDPFDYLSKIPNVYFIHRRIRVRWASYSFLNAILQSLKEVLGKGIHYDFLSLMSGQDYPIKPVVSFYRILENNIGKNFISYEVDGKWWSHAISRIHKYHFTNFGFRGKYKLQFFLNALLPNRKFPLLYELYGGPRAMCMTITPDCADYLVKFVETNEKLRRFIRFTWGPDEFVIPTLIMNSRFKETVINDNFYYIDWTKGGANPKILTSEDYDQLIASDKLMARKFDIRQDTAILDLLDKRQFEN
jgi:Core-2/I-Branching enzyme